MESPLNDGLSETWIARYTNQDRLPSSERQALEAFLQAHPEEQGKAETLDAILPLLRKVAEEPDEELIDLYMAEQAGWDPLPLEPLNPAERTYVRLQLTYNPAWQAAWRELEEEYKTKVPLPILAVETTGRQADRAPRKRSGYLWALGSVAAVVIVGLLSIVLGLPDSEDVRTIRPFQGIMITLVGGLRDPTEEATKVDQYYQNLRPSETEAPVALRHDNDARNAEARGDHRAAAVAYAQALAVASDTLGVAHPYILDLYSRLAHAAAQTPDGTAEILRQRLDAFFDIAPSQDDTVRVQHAVLDQQAGLQHLLDAPQAHIDLGRIHLYLYYDEEDALATVRHLTRSHLAAYNGDRANRDLQAQSAFFLGKAYLMLGDEATARYWLRRTRILNAQFFDEAGDLLVHLEEE